MTPDPDWALREPSQGKKGLGLPASARLGLGAWGHRILCHHHSSSGIPPLPMTQPWGSSLLLHGTLSTPDSSIDILWALHHIITQSQGYPPVPLDSTPRPPLPRHYGNRRCRLLPARLVITASLP